MPTVDYKKRLLKDLKNRKYAGGYLTAALEEGEEVFLLALRDVVQVQLGVSALAKLTKLNRENLYEILSEKGNPRLKNIAAIMDKLGFELIFKPKPRTLKAA